jgi:hypothetical protein
VRIIGSIEEHEETPENGVNVSFLHVKRLRKKKFIPVYKVQEVLQK